MLVMNLYLGSFDLLFSAKLAKLGHNTSAKKIFRFQSLFLLILGIFIGMKQKFLFISFLKFSYSSLFPGSYWEKSKWKELFVVFFVFVFFFLVNKRVHTHCEKKLYNIKNKGKKSLKVPLPKYDFCQHLINIIPGS